MQNIIELGSAEIEDFYVEIVKRMNVFLNKLIELAKKLSNKIKIFYDLGNPIDKTVLKKFRNANDECDLLEDISVKLKLSGENITSSGNKY